MENQVTLVETGSLIKNPTTMGIYQIPKNYDSIKNNIDETKIIEPLIVNKDTMVIISGNLRHQIAEELGFEKVPVIFREVDEDEMDYISISSNQFREKSYSEKLREIEFFEKYYSVKKGQRSDLNSDLKKKKEQRDAGRSYMSNDTIDKLKSIDKLASKLHGKNSPEYIKVIEKLDNGQASLSRTEKTLKNKVNEIENLKVVPDTYDIISNYTTVYNKSSENMEEVSTNSIHSIICSPPYPFMFDYGTGINQIGMEPDINLYLDNLMKSFNECYRVLRNDGSLFVNINDGAVNGRYHAVPHKFVLRMIEAGWILNDELVWIKNNSRYTGGKRTVRSHEFIFHFVKSSNFYYDDSWLKQLSDPENKISYGTSRENPRLLSGLDFRDGVLQTNVANTSELRKECLEKKGFHLTHGATFPLDVPAICALLTTEVDDILMDCFSGTSTVGEFARMNQRRFIGYECKAEYVLASEVKLIKYPSPWGASFEDLKNGYWQPEYLTPSHMI